MKKVLLFLMIAVGAFIMVACSNEDVYYNVEFANTTLEAQKVKSGEKVTKPADPEKNGYDFVNWYEDAELTKEFNFATKITKDTTIYASWKEKDEYVTVVFGVEQNENLATYLANKKEQVNKKTEFSDLTQEFLVGDDNNWEFKPEVSFALYNKTTKESELTTVDKWNYSIKLFDITSTEVEVTDLKTVTDKVDLVNCTIDFNENAIGKKFKIEVIPEGLTDKQKQNIDTYTEKFEFSVVDGFNVYSALDLSYYDRRNPEEEYYAAWAKFKAAKGINTELHPNNFIFQTNIEVTNDDIPAEYFYQKSEVSPLDSDYSRVVGSLKDRYSIYRHDYEEGESTLFSGNYFKLSAEKLAIVVRENGEITPEGMCISHAYLFTPYCEEDVECECTFENLYLIGNAPKVEDTVKAGGVIMIEDCGPTLKANNLISICWFISFMIETDTPIATISKVKGYDAFNSFLYNWGCRNIQVSDSEFIGAGGPVLISDYVADEDHPEDSNVPATSFTNCVLESYVVGTEGWFNVTGSSAFAGQIKALNALFTPFGRAITKTNADKTLEYFNIIAVNKSSSGQTFTTVAVEGSVSIDGFTFDYGKSNPYLAALLSTTFGLGAPAFETNAADYNVNPTAGFAYTDGATGLFDVQQQQIIDPSNTIYAGTYLTVYFMGMEIVLEYFPSGLTR